MRIGFLGGTGIEGKGLALRFASAGAEVVIGSRSEQRAKEVALQYTEIVGKSDIRGMVNREMLAASEVVFLTVPFDQAAAAIESSRADFRQGSVVVDVTVPMKFQGGRAEYLEQASGSNSELLSTRLPEGIHLVGGFKTIPAHILTELNTPLACDVFICGDSDQAKEKVMQAARLIPTLRPLDAGPLLMARTLERMTVLAVHLNRRYKKKGARYHIMGIDD